MELFLSQPKGAPANLPRHLQRVVKLWAKGFLDENSSVWINTNVISPVFWIFNGRAACVWWFDAPTAGCVRLTNRRVRWATSYDSTQSKPEIDLDLRSISIVDENCRVAFVVDHNFRFPGAYVNVIDQKPAQDIAENGYFEHADIAVIDLLNLDPTLIPPLSPSRRTYEEGLARFHGMDLLTRGMSQAARADVIDNTDSYRLELTGAVLKQLAEGLDQFNVAADSFSNHLFGTGPASA